ncbi:MAG: hypothetical protein AB7R77_21205, partial [Ilumatobacteraceae bacterium]
VEGRSTVLPPTYLADRISGDGQYVFVSTDAKLTPADQDGSTDVYAYAWATGTLRLMTQGSPTGANLLDMNAGMGGDSDRVGNIVFTGHNGVGDPVPLFSDGTVVTQLGVSLGPQYSAEALGLSDDGRYALYRVGANLYVEDRTTSVPVQVNVGAAAGQPIGMARLSGDGRHVVMALGALGSPSTVYVRHIDAAQTLTVGAFAEGAPTRQGLGISFDGSVISLLRDAPTQTADGLIDQPGLFLWSNGTFKEASAPAGARPNGKVRGGFVLDDGKTVIFGSEADNLVPGVTPPLNVYINRTGEAVTPSPTPMWGQPSSYTPRTPVRILDTRSGARPSTNSSVSVAVRNHFGVPSNATAVAVQVTATDGGGIGFVSVTPGGAPPGQTSNLNIDRVGETIANLAIVPVGEDGSIDVLASAPTHLIVDLLGWWAPAPGAVTSGRFRTMSPTRFLDTRAESAVSYDGLKPAAGSTTVLQITGRDGVPASGVSAVAVNVTLDGTAVPGFVQAAPAATLVPGATSTLNVTTPGQVVAAATIVPVDGQGRIALYNQPSTHLIVDVTGWFTDETAAASTTGRFVPATDVTRIFDTRPGTRIGWAGTKPPAASGMIVPGGPGSALVGNVTLTETEGAGYVQLGPADFLAPGGTSNINAATAGETVANAFLTPVSQSGLGVYTIVETHLVIDVCGYMTA